MKKSIWFSIILLFSVPVVSHSQGTLYLLGNGTDGSNSAVDVSVVYRAPRIAERVSFDDLKFAYINPFKDRSYTISNLETVIQYAFGTNFF